MKIYDGNRTDSRYPQTIRLARQKTVSDKVLTFKDISNAMR